MVKQQQSNVTFGRSVLIYFVVSLFLVFEMAVQVSPSVMAPHLMHDLNIGAFGLGVMSGFYFYTYASMQIPSGLLFDKHNPRFIIPFSILVCSVGTLLFGFTTNIYLGSFARLFMGAGSAFAFVSVLVVTADLFPSRYFATITGITQLLAALGAMSGQMPVSLVVSQIGWRSTMFVLAAIGIVLSVVVWRLLDYQKSDRHVPSPHEGPTIPQALKRITSNSQTWFIAIYACMLWAPMSGFASLWGVPYLVAVDHLSQHSAAFLCSLMWLGLALSSPFLGLVSTRFNRRVPALAISALIGVVAFGLIVKFTLSVWVLAILLFLAGASCSGQALTFSVVREINSQKRRATAMAFNNIAVVIPGAIFQPLIGRLLQMDGSAVVFHGHRIYSSGGFRTALSTIFIAYFIAFLVSTFLIKETFCCEQS